MVLALFDFDNTLTTADSYTKFLYYATPKYRIVLAVLLLWPLILLYKLGFFPARRLRPILSYFAFYRRKVSEVERIADRFQSYLNSVLRRSMVRQLREHQAQGHRVILVSASLDPYLSIWCKANDIERVSTELNQFNGRYTGCYRHGDCCGEAKVWLLKRATDISDFSTIYAYGDSDEDSAMLNLADIPVYRGKQLANH